MSGKLTHRNIHATAVQRQGFKLTTPFAAAEEPRRSVRATKGQHKALEADQVSPEAPKKRGRKKKAEAEEQEDDVIRCVCGATSDPGDDSPWIQCEECKAWQHNVCMGLPIFEEDLENLEYFCEQCRPENHEELLAAMARGEKPWLARQKEYEEGRYMEGQTKKRGRGKGKGKRNSGDNDDDSRANTRGKPSPVPETKKGKAAAGGKRKSRGPSPDGEDLPQKLRKLSSEPTTAAYAPPADLPKNIAALPKTRSGSATVLLKSLVHAMTAAEKGKGNAATIDSRAERLALEIERAVNDTHQGKKYREQILSLGHNLKSNGELYAGLVKKTLSPTALAGMSGVELASQEQQRKIAEMEAKAEKQAILVTNTGPRMRRTHKGDELVGDESYAMASDDTPSVIRRPSMPAPKEDGPSQASPVNDSFNQVDLPMHAATSASSAQDQSGSKSDFDINKIYSSVNAQSPTTAEHRRPSNIATQLAGGPGVDADIDRMLEDDREESPPYSPSQESDPSIIWRGNVVMDSIANLYATGKHVGGADLRKLLGGSWSALLPKRLNVKGRIETQKAVEYLCSLRYSSVSDVMVASLTPASDPTNPSTDAAREQYETAKKQFMVLYNYFYSKKRYGVVQERGVANVRDTYLVPVPPGSGNLPEFLLNLADHEVPGDRAEPMLLLVLVYRNAPDLPGQPASTSTPTPGAPAQRAMSISAPAFSPASPQGAFPPQNNSFKPPTPAAPDAVAQRAGEAIAAEVLGPLLSSPTVTFILPQAFQMNRQEWENIRIILERDERARTDLGLLGNLIAASMEAATKANGNHQQSQGPQVDGAAAAQAAALRKQTPIPPPAIPPQAAAPPPAS
jgi:hypothetical protein